MQFNSHSGGDDCSHYYPAHPPYSDIQRGRARQGATLSTLKFTLRTSTVASLSLSPPPTQSSGDDLVRLEERESTIGEIGDSKYIIGRKLSVRVSRQSVLDAPGFCLESAAQEDVVEVELIFAGGQSWAASPALDISEHHRNISSVFLPTDKMGVEFE